MKISCIRSVWGWAVVGLGLAWGLRAPALDFASHPLLAGRANLTDEGFTVSRTLGVARFSPELQLPIELVYRSASERTGAFGFAWYSPQLESSLAWEKDGALWQTPWGEKVKFFPKKEKAEADAIKIAVIEEAKRGRGFYAPYAEWEADCPENITPLAIPKKLFPLLLA